MKKIFQIKQHQAIFFITIILIFCSLNLKEKNSRSLHALENVIIALDKATIPMDNCKKLIFNNIKETDYVIHQKNDYSDEELAKFQKRYIVPQYKLEVDVERKVITVDTLYFDDEEMAEESSQHSNRKPIRLGTR